MKTCPICHAVAFDDAAICYGCMHPFDEVRQSRPAHEKKNRDEVSPSRFVVSFTPALENGRTVWGCTVEPVAG